MIESEGKRALDDIERLWALHDAEIRSVSVYTPDTMEVRLDMICIPRRESPVEEARLHFYEVTRFDLQWSKEDRFLFVPSYKAFVRESGDIYLSLAPYDDRDNRPDPNDQSVIEAARLSCELVMKKEGAV